MQRNDNVQGSLVKRFIIAYFERLIRINHETQNSLMFILSVEILRFLLGHTLVLLVFILETLDETQHGIFYSQLKQHLDYDALQNYNIFKGISLCWLGSEIFFIFGFFLKEQWQIKFKIVKILYFMMKYSKISCELMFSIFGLTFYGAMHYNDFIMIIILIVEMAIALILFKITAVYEQKNIFESQDAYTHNHNFGVEMTNLVFCLLTFFGTLFILVEIPAFFRQILILFWVSLQIIRLKASVIFPYYQMETTNLLYSIGVCLQTIQLIVQVLLHFTKLDMLSNNALWLIAILTLFLFQGARNFNKHLIDESYFKNVQELRSDQQFYLLINSYYSALKNLQQNNNLSEVCLIATSIRRDHQNTCKNPECYCREDIQLKQFLKHYLHSILIRMESLFSNNHQIMLYIYSFKFHVYQQYIKIHQQLERLDKVKTMGWLELLLSMALKYKLKKWIDQKNKEFKVIRICLAIRLQEDMSILNDIIIEDIEVRYKKWNSFSKELSRMEEIRNMSIKQLRNYIEIENIKKNKWEDYKQSHAFNFILYFYFKRIALKMDDLADMEKNIKQLNRKIKEQEMNKITLFSKYLFHHNACTVEMSIRQSSIGTVMNTSKSIYRVFGYSNRRIIGQNISILIPHFLSKEYNEMLKNWIEDGESIKNISKVSEALCLHKENIVFLSLQYYKIYSTIEEISLITTFFLKNDNDLILINDEGGIQGFGKGMKPLLKNIPHRVDCDFIFKNMKKKLLKAQLNEQKQQKTIVFNETVINGFINGKRSLSTNEQNNLNQVQKQKSRRKSKQILSQQKKQLQNQIISRVQTITSDNNLSPNKTTHEFLSESTFQYDNVWKLKFLYTKQQYGSQQFYKLKIKNLQQIKNFQEFVSKNQMQISQVKDKLNESDKIVQNDAQIQDLGQQENSSLTSLSSQLGYGISKLVSHFTFILLNPKKLKDKRMQRKFFVQFMFTFSLVAILSATLVINKFSLDQKTTQLSAKSDIDRIFHLLEVSTNNIFNLYSYRADPVAQNTALLELQWDTLTFNNELIRQFKVINEDITPLNGDVLYDYLKTPTNWTFKNSGLYRCELLQYFKINYDLFWDIQNTINNDPTQIESQRDSFTLLTMNAAQLRIVRDYLTTITLNTLASNDQFNITYLIISLVLFLVFSFAFGLYTNIYRKFRFDQNENHIQLYQMVPPDILKSLGDYYAAYYKYYVIGKLRIDSSLDEEKKLFELELQQNAQKQQMSVNKVKLVGKSRYWQWIPIVLIFMLLNGGNIIISYNMYLFNKQVEFFSNLANEISYSKSILLSRWVRLKSYYYFNNDQFNQTYLNYIQSFLDPLDVKFDAYVTFQQIWVTQSDSTFRQDFNNLLTTSPCELNKDEYTDEQLAICNRQALLSKNGLITFVNGFSRALMNLVLEWKKNFDQIKNQTDYIATIKKFREFDLELTFHIPTFNKLNNKITQVYANGFNTEYQSYLIIFILLIILLCFNFIFGLYISHKDKISLSYLYGYPLLFPAFVLKQSKYLLKFIQTNLQFQQRH